MTDPETIPHWRAPAGMTLQISAFEGRTGGQYRMILTYDDPASAAPKSTDRADIVHGSFVELIPDSQIVEEVRFETSQQDFGGTMRITTSLRPLSDGTKVTITAENVPFAISAADHLAGMESTLKNLANFLE